MITILIVGWGVYFIRIQRGVCFFLREEMRCGERRGEREKEKGKGR